MTKKFILERASVNNRHYTALHEAAHAVLDCVFGHPFVFVTMVPEGKAVGRIVPPEGGHHGEDNVRDATIVKLAGLVIEKWVYPDLNLVPEEILKSAACQDYADALTAIHRDVEDKHRVVMGAYLQAERRVRKHWKDIVKVADALFASPEGKLMAEEVQALLQPAAAGAAGGGL